MPAQLREPSKPQYSRSLKQGVEILFEELRMAQLWNRPAILIAACKNHLRLNQAKNALKKKWAEVIEINAEDFGETIALQISNHPKRKSAVFFIHNIAHTGADGHDVFRALNMHREHFVENNIRVIFWLSDVEAAELPRRAIDFWAFRHRVVEFTPGRLPRKAIPIGAFIVEHNKAASRALKEYTRGQPVLALSILEDAIRRDQSNPLLWADAAWIDHTLGRNQAARRKMTRALSIQPNNANIWFGAGLLNLSTGLLDEAQVCLQKSLELKPHEAETIYALAVCFFLSNRKKQSGELLRKLEHKNRDHRLISDAILRGDIPEQQPEPSSPALVLLLEGIRRMS